MNTQLHVQAIDLLRSLIELPSLSGSEDQTATCIEDWFKAKKICANRHNNNVWASNQYFDKGKPTLFLNSHHDTVKPAPAYSINPFEAKIEDGKLFGLGSNDAGASVVALMSVFLYFYEKQDLKFNLLIALTAEEENSGKKGMRSLLEYLPKFDFALVGEPTEMQMAIAEKGLLVIDGTANGVAGHAAHYSGENALYQALDDIDWIRNYQFPKVSELLGKVKMTVTQIEAGTQHNVVPSICHFVIDIRVNELYSNQEVFEVINAHTKSKLIPRSLHLNSSSISEQHPLVQAGLKLQKSVYGSPTLSDQALLSCPSLKMGPGNSSRSHNADEFVYLNEITEGIDIYIKILNEIL
ncbi:MAG: M20 family metallo-hydrolase [Bacteroidales bacterium]|nr:M20 family metallo-hydrolase [Bacteroidales bacterium]